MAWKWKEVDYLSKQQYSGDSSLCIQMMRHRLLNAKSLYRKDLFAHYGCVNAIEFSANGEWLVSGGDDRRVLLWNVEKAISGVSHPIAMLGEHNSNIFCLGFDTGHTRLFSAGNDEQVVVHDIETRKTLDVFLHEEAVYGLSVDPMNDNVFASACDDGRILICDIREHGTSDPFVLANYNSAFHAVMYNPVEPRLIATANSKEGVGLWDVRKPNSCVLRYGGCLSTQSSMSVRFNLSGTSLLALRRRLPPVLYNISSPYPVAEFDHPGYYNSCTMKSCCFAGDSDQYVMSGSDDFKLYMWKIPVENKGIWVNEAHLVLKGHRSIVNQVRYNQANTIFASSGVEKVVKLWSTFPLPGGTGCINGVKDGMRRVYSPEEYISLVLESGQLMTHDYSHKSIQEDPRMMAFFDSLVQRDIEGWTTDSDNSSTNSDLPNLSFEIQSDGSVSSLPTFPSSSSSSGDESIQESPKSSGSLSPQTRSYIYALTSRVEANLQSLQNANKNEEKKDENKDSEETNSDRISELIAQKRHEQLLRVVKTTLKLTKKRLKRKKLSEHSSSNNLSLDSDHELRSLNSARKILNSVLQCQNNMQNKERRKALQLKRTKILRRSLYSEPSSDSDDNTENQKRYVAKSKPAKQAKHTNNTEVASSSTVVLQHISEENEDVNGIVNGAETVVTNTCLSSTSFNTSQTVSPSCNMGEEKLDNGDNVNNLNETTEPTTWTFRKFKSAKNSKRNYRSRDNSDLQDE
ncbi:DDB1- and CUL4-associated factor 5-like [Centruroides vittatus]|uniref:DDB1- and CUL4-associated factor 5-like n=1 Tax=Centruroides vittatus TaxID=120091 RepID=UPI00350F6A51